MTKYIYHSEKTKTTCNECKKHDGEVYYDIKNIPNLPIHPNCKCWVETIYEPKRSHEQCDCSDRFEVLENSLNNNIENSKLMLNTIKNQIFGVEDNLANKFYSIKNKIENYIKECQNLLIDIGMIKEVTFDNTYHTVKQCKSNKELEQHSKDVSKLCIEINDLSEELKQIKEEKREKAKFKKGTITGGASPVEKVQSTYERNINEFKPKPLAAAKIGIKIKPIRFDN